MRIEVVPLDFLGQGALLEPKDRTLHDKAVDYCKRELAGDVNFASFSKVWVALADGEVTGITGFVYKPDIPVFRATGENAARATKMLTDRLHAYFADQGYRGGEVFIHISSKETPEQRCPRWGESLKATDATPADRFSITVR